MTCVCTCTVRVCWWGERESIGVYDYFMQGVRSEWKAYIYTNMYMSAKAKFSRNDCCNKLS